MTFYMTRRPVHNVTFCVTMLDTSQDVTTLSFTFRCFENQNSTDSDRGLMLGFH